jgi:hypothetical protein
LSAACEFDCLDCRVRVFRLAAEGYAEPTPDPALCATCRFARTLSEPERSQFLGLLADIRTVRGERKRARRRRMEAAAGV